MKLCRFELKASPGTPRSGMVYGGKIYETDGANPVAVHEAEAVRPLSPIPHAPSLRIYRTDLQGEAEEPVFFYSNPSHLVGASQMILFPDSVGELSVIPLLAAVLITDVVQIEPHEADDAILGYTMLSLLVAKDYERRERRIGLIGRSHDFGGAIGPVLTTPDELEDHVESDDFGRRHTLAATLKVNGVERGRGSSGDLPFTFGQAISHASQGSLLKTGDIFAIGPIAENEDPIVLDPGDEVHFAVEKLGAISLKLSTIS